MQSLATEALHLDEIAPVKVECWGASVDLMEDEAAQDLVEELLDAKTPKKVYLPIEASVQRALKWNGCMGASQEEETFLYQQPSRPMPPSLPNSMTALESPPPSAASAKSLVPLSLNEVLNSSNPKEEVAGVSTGPPHSPPPSKPPALPATLSAALEPQSPPPAPPTPMRLALPAEAMRWEATPDQAWLVGGTPWSAAKAKVELSKLLTWGASADDSSQEDDSAEQVEQTPDWADAAGDSSPTKNRAAGFPPGLEPPRGTPSHGSALHGTGHCRPCAWFWKAQGCQNELECGHCHLCPEGEIKARKKAKRTVMRMGLATPKVGSGTVRALGAAFQQEALVPSDPESTAAPSDQNSLSGGGPGSEQELVAGLEWESPPDEASVEPPPGLPRQSVGFASEGSALHGTGECRPCAWFWKPVGCQSGRACAYCHECPEGAVKARKKCKQAMLRMGLSTPKTDFASEQQAMYFLGRGNN